MDTGRVSIGCAGVMVKPSIASCQHIDGAFTLATLQGKGYNNLCVHEFHLEATVRLLLKQGLDWDWDWRWTGDGLEHFSFLTHMNRYF